MHRWFVKLLTHIYIYMYMFFIYSLTTPVALLMTINPAYMAEENQEISDDELKFTFCKTG